MDDKQIDKIIDSIDFNQDELREVLRDAVTKYLVEKDIAILKLKLIAWVLNDATEEELAELEKIYFPEE